MKIIVKPRIHITLISMHESGYRRNGGIGFSINEPNASCTFEISDKFELSDKRGVRFSKEDIEDIKTVLNKAQKEYSLKKNIKCSIEGAMLPHHGFGAGTAIRLACVEALFILNKKTLSEEELIANSMRGGTSGIGIHTYFKGGFIFDLGVPIKNGKLLPSSQVKLPHPPLVLDNLEMPEWEIGLCIDGKLKPKTREEEINFFKKTCPIEKESSFETLYHSTYGIDAAIREKDFFTFSKAIQNIQKCEWKRKERAEYGEQLSSLEDGLYNAGANAVGMSSLGPLLYFFFPSDKKERFMEVSEALDCNISFATLCNTGRSVN